MYVSKIFGFVRAKIPEIYFRFFTKILDKSFYEITVHKKPT